MTSEIIDVYEGKDPERNKAFAFESMLREVHGENYNVGEVVNQIKNDKELDQEKQRQEFLSLYSKIKEILNTYMDMSEYAYHTIALWIIGTYCYESFNTFPLLFINAVRGSGKTRLLKLIEAMAWNGKIEANLKEAVIFRTKKLHTIIIDEFEQVASKDSNTLRELINASYKRGAIVERMKEVTKEGKKSYEVESFDLYSPLVMANIWGMDDTVKDRCIVIHLDKSNNDTVTRLMEDFKNDEKIQSVKNLLLKHYKLKGQSVDNVDVATLKTLVSTWNDYVLKKSVDKLYTLYTLSTLSSLATLFEKIYETEIYGRDLELFFPLFIISNRFGEEILNETLEFSKQKFKEKNLEEYTDNPDIILLEFLWKNYHHLGLEYIYLHDIKSQYQLIANLKELDTRTLSKMLERLNIIMDKKRDSKGVKVMIDLAKTNEKLKRYGEAKNE